MAIRKEDPETWSYERLRWPEDEYEKTMYRGWIRDMRELLHDDWDIPIVCTGMNGAGKSTFALNLAIDLDDDIEDNLEKHCFWYVVENVDRFKKIVATMPPSVIILDEAGVDAGSRDSMTRTSREIVKLFTIAREFNHCVILNIPDIWDLDNYFRERRVQYKIWVDWLVGADGGRTRAKATIRRREKKEFMRSAYWPGLLTIRFPDMPESIRTLYKQKKRENTLLRLGLTEEEEEGVVPGLSMEEDIVLSMKNNGLSYRQIGKYLGCGKDRIGNIYKAAMDKVKEDKSHENV